MRFFLCVLFLGLAVSFARAQTYNVSQISNTCPDLQVLGALVDNDRLIVTMQVASPQLTNYLVKDTFAGLSTRVGVLPFSITNTLKKAAVGWHGFVLYTNFDGVGMFFNGVAQTNSVQVRVSKIGSDLLWFAKGSAVFTSSYRRIFSGGCMIVGNSAIVNQDNGSGVNATAYNLIDGYPGRVLTNLVAHAADLLGNLILADANGSLVSWNSKAWVTNWIHPFATVINFTGNPVAIDEIGRIHLAGNATDVGGKAAIHHLLDPVDGHTIEASLPPPRVASTGASIALAADGTVLGVEEGSSLILDAAVSGGYQLSSQCAFDSRGNGYANSSYAFRPGLIRVGIAGWKHLSVQFNDFAVINDDLVVGMGPKAVLQCFSASSNAVVWSITNSAFTDHIPLPLSEGTLACVTSAGFAVVRSATGEIIKVLSDSDVLGTAFGGSYRFAVDDRGVLLVATGGGIAAFDVHDYVDPAFVRNGNGCWFRFGGNGQNTQQQPKLPMDTNVVASLKLRYSSRFSAKDSEGNLYIGDRFGIRRISAGLTSTNWQVTDASLASEMILDDSGVYYCGRDGALRKRDKTSGVLLWERFEDPVPPMPGPAAYAYQTPFAASGDCLFAADDQGRLGCWLKSDGSRVWLKSLGANGIGRLAIVPNGQLFVATLDGYVMSFDSASGALQWRTFLGDNAYAHLGVAIAPGGRVMVPLYDGSVVFLNPFSGELVDTRQISGVAADLPVLDDAGNLFASINTAGAMNVVRASPGEDPRVLYSGSRFSGGQIHLINGQSLLISDDIGQSEVLNAASGEVLSQFYVVSRTLGGWRHLAGSLFFMDGNRLQIRRIDPDGLGNLDVRSSKGPDDNSGLWQTIVSAPSNAIPRNLTLALGAHQTLIAPVFDTNALGYQWTFNGQPIAGATNYFLSLMGTGPEQNGAYGVGIRFANQVLSVSVASFQVATNKLAGHIDWTTTGRFLANAPLLDEQGAIHALKAGDEDGSGLDSKVSLVRLDPGNGTPLKSLLITSSNRNEDILPRAFVGLGGGRYIVQVPAGIYDADISTGEVSYVGSGSPYYFGGHFAKGYDGNVVFRDADGFILKYDTISRLVTAVSTNGHYSDLIVLPGNAVAALAYASIDIFDINGPARLATRIPLPNGVTASYSFSSAAMSLGADSQLLLRLMPAYVPQPATVMPPIPGLPNISGILIDHKNGYYLASYEYPLLSGQDGVIISFDNVSVYSVDRETGVNSLIYTADNTITGLAAGSGGNIYVVTAGDIVAVDGHGGGEKWRIDLPFETEHGDFVGGFEDLLAGVAIGQDGSLLVQGSDYLASIYTGDEGVAPGWPVMGGSPDGIRRPHRVLPPSKIADEGSDAFRLSGDGLVPGIYTLSASTDLLHWSSSLLIADPQTATNGIALPAAGQPAQFFRVQ